MALPTEHAQELLVVCQAADAFPAAFVMDL